MTLQKTFIQSERKTPGWDAGLWFSWQKQAILRGTCWVICSYFSCSKSYNPNVCSKNCHWNQLFQHFQINWQVLVHWIMLIWEIQNVSIDNAAFFCSVILYIPINLKCMWWEIWTEHWRKWTIRYDMIWKIKGASSNFLGGLRQIHFQPSPALNCFQLVIATQSPAWFIFIFHPMCLCDSIVDTTSEWSAQTLQGQLLLILSDKDKILTTPTPESRHTV